MVKFKNKSLSTEENYNSMKITIYSSKNDNVSLET